ncbi:hypothetical protein [Cyanobacterium aponinum]|uniref:Uncharacterized protein n=1 Tax=Cyanobacterium aponinum 0216 TaxID=2676140 RepID=A0A844GRW5_9CHRO|nr:hypothetical protein [Cyanobacterium aponinum]MTF37488.1 hypothetical protein [Cyanobacterium aponinum 0216]
MTGQIPDTFIYKEDKFELVYLKGGDLITPQDYGMNPQMLHTTCYRGFYSTYEIKDNQLLLQEMVVGEITGQYPEINGVEPKQQDYRVYYENLSLLTDFTGVIRIAKELIDTLYIHMGYQKGTAYKTLLELKFQHGSLINVKDLSKQNRKGAFKKSTEKTSPLNIINNSFDLTFDDLLEEN